MWTRANPPNLHGKSAHIVSDRLGKPLARAASRRLPYSGAAPSLPGFEELTDSHRTMASLTPNPGCMPGRRVARTCRGPIVTVLAMLAPPAIPCQPRPDELRFTVGTATFIEAEQHATLGGAYRKYLGRRGWAVEPEYSAMIVPDHVDNILTLSLVKDLSRPMAKRVWYMSMGGGINHQVRTASGWTQTAIGGLAWGLGMKGRIGRRWKLAPQVRVGFEPNIRFELCVSWEGLF